MGQFVYIACVDCQTYAWLDKLSTDYRREHLAHFMRFGHTEHVFKLIVEDHPSEQLLDTFKEETRPAEIIAEIENALKASIKSEASVFICGPSKCEHLWDIKGENMTCSRCGARYKV